MPEEPLEITQGGKKIYGRNSDGVAICNAMLKGNRRGEYCQKVGTLRNGRCSLHGGLSVNGELHWRKDPLRSPSNMPKYLQNDLYRALNDPDLLSLNHELALKDVHIAQLKSALACGLDGRAWENLMKSADKLEESLETDEKSSISPELANNIANMVNYIRIGSGERAVWKELDSAILIRAKLSSVASQREIQLKTMLKADQAIALVTALVSTIKECVSKFVLDIESGYVLIDNSVSNKSCKLPEGTRELLDSKGIMLIDKSRVKKRLDVSYKTNFMNTIAVKLGGLISKNRSIPQRQILLPAPEVAKLNTNRNEKKISKEEIIEAEFEEYCEDEEIGINL